MIKNETVFTNENPNIKTKTNLKWGPVGSYLMFISNIVFKSVGTWVTLGIFLFVYFIVSIIPAFISITYGDPLLEMATTISMYATIVLIVFSGILGILKTLNIFIDSQKDGIEILIVSKPITRKQIIFTRFLFLFLFAIGVSLCFLILTVIAAAIVGFSNYANAGAMIGLVFVISLFSFCCFGMLACAIGLISSGKTARVLPSVIISLSAIIAILGQSTVPVFASQDRDFTKDVLTDVQKMVNADIKDADKMAIPIPPSVTPPRPNGEPGNFFDTTNPIYKWEYENNKDITEIAIIDYQYQDYGYSDKLRLVSLNDPSSLKFIYFNNINVTVDGNNINSGAESLLGQTPVGGEGFTLGQMLQSYLGRYLANYTVDASGWTAINYINPISAFAAIGNPNNDFSIFGNSFNFNYSYSDFTRIHQIQYKDYYNELRVDNPIIIGSNERADPQWGVAILWLVIFAATSGLVVFSYLRKDFN